MKIFKPGIPDVKRGLLYLLIIGLCSPTMRLSAFKGSQNNAYEGAACMLVAGMGLSVVWALYERISKKNAKQEANKLQSEIDAYKSDERIKGYLAKMNDNAVLWENFFSQVCGSIGNVREDEPEFIEKMVDCICQQIKKTNLSIDEFHSRINKGIEDTINKINELDIQKNSWEKNSHFVISAERVINHLNIVLTSLKKYNTLFEEQKDYIKLLFFLDQGIEQEYEQEIEYAYAQLTNWPEAIDHIIRTKSNQLLFPYLFYAQDLQSKLDELVKYVNKLSNFKDEPFQTHKINRARYVYDALHLILKFVSTSDTLAKEKEAKIEHDRKEEYVRTEIAERKELLRLETKERESKIAHQKALAEAKILEQRNKERNILNEKARLASQKQEMELRSQDNALQLARIHEGQGIKKALDENDRKWRTDYNNLNANYSSLQAKHQQLSSANNNNDAELKKLRVKVSTLESDIKATHSNHNALERYARSLELKIKNVAHALDALRNKVNTPPVNPQSVYGLSEYLNNLQMQVQQLKTIVS